MALISAGTLGFDGQLRRPGWLQTSGSQVLAGGAGPPPGPVDHDFPDSVVVPGFIDMHVHGGGGASYTEAAEIDGAARFHLCHATTTPLASLVTAAPAPLIAGVRALTEAVGSGVVAGIHLEGPWLSTGRCGAHDRTQMRDPDAGAIRRVTLAPERPGGEDAIRRFADAGVVVAVGHTDAGYEQTERAVGLG